jgi:hypothetical protein
MVDLLTASFLVEVAAAVTVLAVQVEVVLVVSLLHQASI